VNLGAALNSATDTRHLLLSHGALDQTSNLFHSLFPSRPAVIISDANTFPIAGKKLFDLLKGASIPVREPFIFTDPNLYAEHSFVAQLEASLRSHDAIPLAVGAGTINDIVKLASHRTKRPYIAVATAASMDGYTAFGASIECNGSKQTFDCPAPIAVVADLDVILSAPPELNAAGYGDLLAKITAGADWLVADALQIEPIDPVAWEMVQSNLRRWTSNPSGICSANAQAIADLIEGLLMTGFVMQRTKSSRPASGAEHQFSHLWDMQHHKHNGQTPPHGFKVAIGTLAVTRLYEHLLSQPFDQLDIERICKDWPDMAQVAKQIHELFDIPELAQKAIEETRLKHSTRDQLRSHLTLLKLQWPTLAKKLRAHLIPTNELAQMLSAAGVPTTPEQIGISNDRLRDSYLRAYHIRRRYTALDLAVLTDSLTTFLAP
jgi:glycerol-1-phosphate dehydrogenase [NAD(P)+]